MITRLSLALLVTTLGTLLSGGDAHALPCGIAFPCPSDIYQITDSGGVNVVTDINGNPASRTVSEVGSPKRMRSRFGAAHFREMLMETRRAPPSVGALFAAALSQEARDHLLLNERVDRVHDEECADG